MHADIQFTPGHIEFRLKTYKLSYHRWNIITWERKRRTNLCSLSLLLFSLFGITVCCRRCHCHCHYRCCCRCCVCVVLLFNFNSILISFLVTYYLLFIINLLIWALSPLAQDVLCERNIFMHTMQNGAHTHTHTCQHHAWEHPSNSIISLLLYVHYKCLYAVGQKTPFKKWCSFCCFYVFLPVLCLYGSHTHFVYYGYAFIRWSDFCSLSAFLFCPFHSSYLFLFVHSWKWIQVI